MTEWQPIETAPKDGTRILAYGEIGLETALGISTVAFNTHYKKWQQDPTEASEYDPEECKLTHWQSLPEPPK